MYPCTTIRTHSFQYYNLSTDRYHCFVQFAERLFRRIFHNKTYSPHHQHPPQHLRQTKPNHTQKLKPNFKIKLQSNSLCCVVWWTCVGTLQNCLCVTFSRRTLHSHPSDLNFDIYVLFYLMIWTRYLSSRTTANSCSVFCYFVWSQVSGELCVHT